MQEANGEVVDAFRQYADAFRALDAKAVARHFHAPAMLITPDAAVPLPDAAAVERTYAGIIEDLPEEYADTEFFSLEERRLGDNLALVTGAGTWKNASGEGFMSFGMTYTLRRSGEQWRIIVAAIHAPQAAAR